MLELQDNQWPMEYTDHDRIIVRAIVYDKDANLYFMRADRDDKFGRCRLIETSGGGVENGEELEEALKRELREELGAEVEITCKIGIVSDYYNLIHRHNINHYYLCRVLSFGDTHLMQNEIDDFHLKTLKLRYEQAFDEYVIRSSSKLGKLIAKRELPVLMRARKMLKGMGIQVLTPLTEKNKT